ncbi:MAG: hypothetical protein K8M05_20565 [Deltaproteobacteria bacterium]|nr:hypothetical protein [Kofleriaceae bacterium]
MSELAFDLNGDPIILPAHAQYWRVRRFRSPGSRGAPEVVTTREGAPLILPIDVGFIEFQEIVEKVPGRYRLDPIDEKRKIISNAPAAYLTIAEHPPRNGAGLGELGSLADGPDSVLRDLARANVEMARVNADVSRNIADRFAGIMQAAAEVIRAADGAGIVSRLPPPPTEPDGEELLEGEELDVDQEPTLAGLAAQILPMIQMWLQVKHAKTAAAAMGGVTTSGATAAAEAAQAPPIRNTAPTPAQVAHLMAVQKLLTPQEAAVAQATAAKLSAEDRAELLAELETMTVEQAAAFVRSMLPTMKVSAS